MVHIPSITDAEWPIMRLLWDAGPAWLSAADIVEPVSRERRVNHRTIRTLLARLVKKGAVATREVDRGYLYRASVSRDLVTRDESHTFLSRVFDGKAAPALVHLLEESRDKLSREQLDELRDLLNRKGKP